MKTWIKPILWALAVTIFVVVILAITGLTNVPILNVTLVFGGLIFVGVIFAVAAFLFLRNINPQLRYLRNLSALIIIAGILLVAYVIFLAFTPTVAAGTISLGLLTPLLFFAFVLLFAVICFALYFTVEECLPLFGRSSNT